MKRYDRALVWFRRDLRTEDHVALSRALSNSRAVYCVFVFDTEILESLTSKSDRRVEFIWLSVQELRASLQALGGDLHVLVGRAREEIPAFVRRHGIEAVYLNHDYEPEAIARDKEVSERLAAENCALHSFKDQVIYEKSEILNAEARPYIVFTPYKRAWLARLDQRDIAAHTVADHAGALDGNAAGPLPTLEQIGFAPTNLSQLGIDAGVSGASRRFEEFLGRIGAYAERRDFPALPGTSLLSVHLRFGTISIRELVRSAVALDADAGARSGAATWLSELIWREFYFSILWHFPHVASGAFVGSTMHWGSKTGPHISKAGVRARPAILWWTRPCGS